MAHMHVNIDRTASEMVRNLEEFSTEKHNQVTDLLAENRKLKSDLEFIRKQRRRLEEKLVEGGLG